VISDPDRERSRPPDADAARFEPRAAREMATMFDDVSDRYELLNRILSLGRDAAWREAMWREVPDDARIVLDLCTGNGASLPGLRQPGRLVIGVDVSLRMLRHAADEQERAGWAPRLVGADGFRLPLRSGLVDAVTVAFGVRNLRPRSDALAEIARVLRPGGTLIVLEATAPRPGPFSGVHAFYLTRVVPFAGRLSHDPSAYEYLSRSIIEFGDGQAFERDLSRAGFAVRDRRAFLLGATTLWVAERGAFTGEGRTAAAVQGATMGESARGRMPTRASRRAQEWRTWSLVQLGVTVVLLASLIWAWRVYASSGGDLPLQPWQRQMMRFLLAAGVLGFAFRAVVLTARILGATPRR
jgi:demethylmenaquinone methyltransferase / 2-methoxy-6-polyprenyl-1,4-benzoquinol methylase